MNILTKLNNKIPKYKGFKQKWSVYRLAGLLIFCILTGSVLNDWMINNKLANADIMDAKGKVKVLGQVMAKNVELEDTVKQQTAELEAYKSKHPDPTREEIEAYVRKIFGKDANIALAVSHHECGYTNKNYPKCHLKSGVEHSVGLFQINLYNSKQWIHAGRIPGVTMEEKVVWLENPFNNTLYAYWVFKTSGWNPWSAYKNGSYLADMKGK